MIINQTSVEPIEPIPQAAMPVFMSPPAEFEIINPPDNYMGPITNVPTQPYVMPSNEKAQETSPDEFYNWVVHPDNKKAEDVLFKRP
jgi:hypothetical protein